MDDESGRRRNDSRPFARRHRLATRRRGRANSLMVEEAGALAWRGIMSASVIATGLEALSLLDQPAEATPPEAVIRRMLEGAKARLVERRADLDEHAIERADILRQDHDRVRIAARASGASEVEAVTPVDVIGLYVLLPVEV